MPGSEPFLDPGAPLGPLTWFKLGGPADLVARPRTPDELSHVVRRSHDEGSPVRVLGGGSNVLVADRGVRGTVVLLTADPFKSLARTGEDTVQCGAGARLARVVGSFADWGLAGAEALAGIPGTVGGACRTNAGTPAGETGTLVKRVWTVDADGAPVTLSGPECSFEYRSSSLGSKIILGAELLARRGEPGAVRARMKELLQHRAATQPRGVSSAGCIFRNPAGLSAGKLLDELGMKGVRNGGARVSPVHANFIEAEACCTAADVKGLIDSMRARSRDERGVELELQLELWGFDDED